MLQNEALVDREGMLQDGHLGDVVGVQMQLVKKTGFKRDVLEMQMVQHFAALHEHQKTVSVQLQIALYDV